MVTPAAGPNGIAPSVSRYAAAISFSQALGADGKGLVSFITIETLDATYSTKGCFFALDDFEKNSPVPHVCTEK